MASIVVVISPHDAAAGVSVGNTREKVPFLQQTHPIFSWLLQYRFVVSTCMAYCRKLLHSRRYAAARKDALPVLLYHMVAGVTRVGVA